MIKKIVLTGGPGSGKTTVIESIKENLGGKYKVIVIDETASYLINMGIRPFGDGQIPLLDFQELVLKMQLAKEDIINRSLDFLPDNNVIIIYDRGLLDNSAYITKDEFEEILQRLEQKHTINEFLNRYDLILTLVSRKDFYTTDNNPARSEAVEEALELGSKTLSSWVGHPNMKIVNPKDHIEDKIKEVLSYINQILEEKEVKTQRKYLVDIENLDFEQLERISKKAYMTQDYLESKPSVEKRLRKVTMNGVDTYHYTVYKTLESGEKVKVSDESISERMYKKLLEFKDEEKRTIKKVRYYFPYEDEYFTLDKMEEYAILEINVKEDEIIQIPPFIPVLEDVSHNPNYKSVNIASQKNKEKVKN